MGVIDLQTLDNGTIPPNGNWTASPTPPTATVGSAKRGAMGLQCVNAGGSTAVYLSRTSPGTFGTGGTMWIGCWFKSAAGTPSGYDAAMAIFNGSGSAFYLAPNKGGAFSIMDNGGASQATVAVAFAVGTWYWLQMGVKYDTVVNGGGVSLRVSLDGKTAAAADAFYAFDLSSGWSTPQKVQFGTIYGMATAGTRYLDDLTVATTIQTAPSSGHRRYDLLLGVG